MMFRNLATKTRSRKAFSLLEISIVIVIVGILMAGIGKSNFIVQKYRFSNAQTLTKSSPVNRISGLLLWLETTSETSLTDSEASDASAISTWYDLNPQSNIKNNATSSSTTRPLYTLNCINSLPCLRFDGVNDLMTFDGTDLLNSNYTIFVVEERRSSGSSNYFIGGTTLVANQNLILGYRNNTTLTQAHYTNDMDYTISGYTTPTPTIHTFMFNTSSGKSYWVNGGDSAASTSTGQTSPITAFVGAAIGRYNASYYSGDIVEIIMFRDSLLKRDRREIEQYLGKKWKINVTNP